MISVSAAKTRTALSTDSSSPEPAEAPDSGRAVYAKFIEAELKAEESRRDSVHKRAAAAVTSSTGLITLVLGVFGFLVGENPGFPDGAKPYLFVAVVALLLAGVCGVGAAFPVGQKFVKDKTIFAMLDSRGDDPVEVARDAVAFINAVGLKSLRSGTTKKALLLFASGLFQISAMIAVGGCIWKVIELAR